MAQNKRLEMMENTFGRQCAADLAMTHFFEAVRFKRFVHALNNPRVAFADINRRARQLQHTCQCVHVEPQK